MKILFYDSSSEFVYDPTSFEHNALGGTEATVIRVAEALSSYHEIVVTQKHRLTREHSLNNVRYTSTWDPCIKDADVLICIRHVSDDRILNDDFCKNFKGKVYVLCQNFDKDENENGKLSKIGPFLKEKKGTLVSVSNHLMEINRKLLPDIDHVCIYNPIDDDLREDNTPRSKNKLVFFSSPHKGLFDTFTAFNILRSQIPELTLYYTNPGYVYYPHRTPEGAINLNSLCFTKLMKLVRECFCVFYINRIFPETFGLIYAEANAVGVPVLAHDFGSAREILHPNNPVIDCNSLHAIIDTFISWYIDKPPIVSGVDKFRTSNVVKEWLKLIEGN